MKIVRVLLIAGVLAGCGGSGDEEEPESAAEETPVATQAPADAEAEIKKLFDGYNAALAERDWGGACEALAPETTAKLRENVTNLGVKDPPQECAEVLGLVYETADKDPQQKELLDEIVNSAKVDSVVVTGDTAKVNWSAQVQGQNTPISQTARRVDGEWKLVDVTN